ncbi:efflux RND transporter permease subunit [Accumulibacter sp.]|jgi:HME family heavy-metal exporter|uniref:efflux RND transporter permease subunit n=1 Tax=Accumulibacter sp. TaxID=2053492 RepID=UPI001ACD16D7|nr:efflux RND transporter permease subunit [Accumulibacter sp.]MBN8454135.1 efflux RND transporter permease subunit [Accumulibacter sp.]MBO3708448.1 efflux RND transporter permease subunit [Candidatus Accumulibacter conexus]
MFKTIVEKSLSQRLLVLAAAIVLILYGALVVQKTPVDVFPDLNKPTVTLMTEAGGMAPEEVEALIAFPIETAMNGMAGVAAVRSVSSAGLSIVYVQFDWEVEIYRARQMIAERLSLIQSQLPPGVVPHMGPVASIMGEILLIAIPITAPTAAAIEPAAGAAPAAAQRPAMAAREYADWVLRPRLLTIPGVAQVVPIGGEVRQFQVQPDTVRMAALGITLDQVDDALRGFAANTSGGFLELNSREYLIRNLGRTSRLEDLQRLPLTARNGQPILLAQVASVGFAPAIRRGDAGLNGQPAVILSVQKQPAADTVALTRQVEAALAELKGGLPVGMAAPRVTFRQADFIEASIRNLELKLAAAAVFVAAVLYLFLGNLRATLISLTAIPVSILTAALVFRYFGLSINTMTLGGLAIAIGELVDDAVVDLENIIRRLRQNRQKPAPEHPLRVIVNASNEVRSGIVVSTLIIALVFVPLFALPGLEGRFFIPLGVAYLTAILASLVVSITLTPVLAWYLLRHGEASKHGDTRFVAWLKSHYQRGLEAALAQRTRVIGAAGVAALLAATSVPFFATTFLPPFNEGAAFVGLRLNPGITLAESVKIGTLAEQLVREVPEVTYVGRRSGRAELDEHAEGVHVSELDMRLKPGRPPSQIHADLRARLASLPATVSIGQPISHRIDHMLSGVRAQIAIRIVGDDLDVLRGEGAALRDRLATIPGLADLELEKQVLAPQIKVRIDYARAEQYGVSPAALLRQLQTLIDGEQLGQVIEGARRFALVLRLPEEARGLSGLANLMIETPNGRVPLARVATIEDGDGPNQISRDSGRRRIVISANAQGRPLSDVVDDVRSVIAETNLPSGYFITIDGQFRAQEEAARIIGVLALISLGLIFIVLYSRYRSAILAALVIANVPLALIGSVIGLWLSGQPLSIATLIGFITLAGIATRNGILKLSHYANLVRFEGETFGRQLVIRGSLERLTPVLMTALVAAFALAPLLFEAEAPGTEILHPVAVVIFSGLISSTLLDAFVTPALFLAFGEKPLDRLLESHQGETF